MKTVQVKEVSALQAYNKLDEKGKEVLKDLFGKDFFKQDAKDRVKTLEDVFAIVNPNDEQKVLLFYQGKDRKMIGAKNFMTAEMITEALNDGWLPDWSDTNQPKWFPVFDGSEGFGFSGTHCDGWGTYTSVGSRLSFRTEELAEYAAKTFPDVFKEILTK